MRIKTDALPRTVLPDQKRRRHRTVRVVLVILLTLIVLVGAVISGISIYYSNTVLRLTYTPPTYSLAVTEVSANTVTLLRTSDTQRPGEYEIEWPGGQAIVGPIISADVSTVTRQLLESTGTLSPGTLTYWLRGVYTGQIKDSMGLSIEDVQVPDPLGAMPAFYVLGKRTTWVLLVHGYGSSRDETLRAFQPLAKLGLPLLAISYRNDIGSPASPDGLSHLGDTEVQDLEAGARYALAHGAQHLVLYGWSMGGTMAEEFEQRSSYAHYVQALVLDAPVLDWTATLAYQAQKRSLPGFFANTTEVVSSIHSGINFAALDQLSQTQTALPTLLFHGTGDTTTPIAVSDAFASAHSSFVTYVRVPDAEHTEAWNTNPQAYDAQLTMFLTRKLGLKG